VHGFLGLSAEDLGVLIASVASGDEACPPKIPSADGTALDSARVFLSALIPPDDAFNPRHGRRQDEVTTTFFSIPSRGPSASLTQDNDSVCSDERLHASRLGGW